LCSRDAQQQLQRSLGAQAEEALPVGVAALGVDSIDSLDDSLFG